MIVEDGDIFGDGVNVAARLETMAEPGGICISAAVRDQVGDRLKVAYADLGEQQVKNITRPIRAYKVLIDGQASQASHAGQTLLHASPASAKKPSIAILPFDNMSGDPEQEFFVDGLTEDMITELSRFRELLGDLPQRGVRPQGQAGQGQASRARVRGRLHRRGKRPQGGGPGQGHHSAHRRRDRNAYLGRTLRSQA